MGKRLGDEVYHSMLELEKQKESGSPEPEDSKPKTLILNYKCDVVDKIHKVSDEVEARVKTLDSARDIIVSAHICATKLQAIMRGRQDRKKVKKKGKKSKKT